MKKRTKLALGGLVAIAGAVLLSGCTQSFCSNNDQGRMLYAFDPGVTRYVAGGSDTFVSSTNEGKTYTINNFSYEYATWNSTDRNFEYASDGKKLTYLNNVINSSRNSGYVTINENTLDYYKKFDALVLDEILNRALDEKDASVIYDLSNEEDYAAFNRDLHFYSYLKFVDDGVGVWDNYEAFDALTRNGMDESFCPSSDFYKIFKSSMNSNVAAYRTCLTTKTDKYGTYGYSTEGIYINAKSWSYAWSKGLFEGLLVYPIGWLIDQISFGFQGAGVATGWAALLAIFFVTLIVRSIMLLATMKQTTGNAKMTELQPEIQKIQNKYPNANTSQTEKQRMAEEMNRLYKKNKINPLSTFLVMIVQFPVFICVWGALSGSATLASGKVLGLDLSLGIRDVLFNATNWTAAGEYAAVTALILFILMSLAQTLSMLLPQWIQKKKAKEAAKLGKNPAAKAQDNKMKWFTYIMLAMIIFMGFSLVSAMGVYWFIGAIFSIAQTLITQLILKKKSKK